MLSKLATRVGAVVGIGCTIHCFFEYVCDFVVCTGESMQPTLYANDILICDKSARKYEAKYSRNDIVISIHPNSPSGLICKRLVALPGDLVLMNSSDVTDEANTKTQTIYIKPGSCWLEGDNRTNSTDSRNYGQLPLGLLKSKVLARVWPPSQFRIF